MERQAHTVCMIGLGYVGLPMAAFMASRGMDVVGIDSNPALIASIEQGRTKMAEPGLDTLIASGVASGCLRVSERIEAADMYMIAVPTPITASKCADMSYIRQAVWDVAVHLKPGDVVVLLSTCAPGTTQAVQLQLAQLRPDLVMPTTDNHACDVHIAYCPEHLTPGDVLAGLLRNERIIGGLSRQCTCAAIAFYEHFVEGACHGTHAATLELARLCESAYHDVQLAYAHEVAHLCERHGVHVDDVLHYANRHPKVDICPPGIGVGGPSIPVDPWFMTQGAAHGTSHGASLLHAARHINDARPGVIVQQVVAKAMQQHIRSIACLGISSMADTDDLRASPAVEVLQGLREKLVPGCTIYACDPYVRELPQALSSRDGIALVELPVVMARAQMVVTLVRHRPFHDITAADMYGKIVLDYARIWT